MMTAEAVGTVEANVALGRRFFAEQDGLRGGPAEALCAPEYRATIGGNADMPREGHEAFAKGFYAAFPDAYHEIVEAFGTSDRVSIRFIISGTNTGSFFGMPPTGRAMSVAANVIMHVAGGKVTKLLALFDEAGLLRQLGVLPTGH